MNDEWWGLRKIREDWNHRAPSWLGGWKGFGLVLDHLGHLGIGLAAGLAPALLGWPFWISPVAAASVGAIREAVQVATDNNHSPNLVDRFMDVLFAAGGGALAGLVPRI